MQAIIQIYKIIFALSIKVKCRCDNIDDFICANRWLHNNAHIPPCIQPQSKTKKFYSVYVQFIICFKMQKALIPPPPHTPTHPNPIKEKLKNKIISMSVIHVQYIDIYDKQASSIYRTSPILVRRTFISDMDLYILFQFIEDK